MAILARKSAFSRVTTLAALRPVHTAFAWLYGNPKTIMDWQIKLVSIPAPLNGEQERAAWLSAQFAAAGSVSYTHLDVYKRQVFPWAHRWFPRCARKLPRSPVWARANWTW